MTCVRGRYWYGDVRYIFRGRISMVMYDRCLGVVINTVVALYARDEYRYDKAASPYHRNNSVLDVITAV